MPKSKIDKRNIKNRKSSSDYPCGICDEEVGDNDDGIFCESGCDLWYHRTCTGMTTDAYKLLTTEVDAEWACDNCIVRGGVKLVIRKPDSPYNVFVPSNGQDNDKRSKRNDKSK
ncbi:hypothetical protein ACHWQZ_G009317 [Mnemiopsis leidyi]